MPASEDVAGPPPESAQGREDAPVTRSLPSLTYSLRKAASRKKCNVRTGSTKPTPVTTESGPYAYGPMLARAEAATAALNAQRRNEMAERADGFKYAGPYQLDGPLPSKTRPDVWAVYKAATAARYEVEFCPGLVLRLGYGNTFMSFYVTFDHKFHQRFHEASSASMYFSDLAEFCAWLAAHPYIKGSSLL